MKLKDMDLHAIVQLGNIKILRVLGGWIYTFENKRFCSGAGEQIVMSSVFVPEPPENNIGTTGPR